MRVLRSIILISILLLCALILFVNLGSQTIRLYDESRGAMNVYEMQRSGEWIVTHFGGEPDMWNTKPPLLIWIQVLFSKLLGIGEWSIRLPSAVAAFMVCITLLVWLKRSTGSVLPGAIAMLVLVTSLGFTEQHCARTGDYDALLSLFVLLYALQFYQYVETGRNHHLYYGFLFIALALLTKGVAGLLMTPGIFMYFLIRRKLMGILTSRHLYLGIAMVILLVGWYYLARELRNPGYLEAMANNELLGRYLQPLEVDRKGFFYFFEHIYLYFFWQWRHILMPALLISLFSGNRNERRLVGYSGLLSIIFLLVISASSTKHYWYAMPVFPFFAIIIGIGIHRALQWIMKWQILAHPVMRAILLVGLLTAIFYEPARKMVTKQLKAEEYAWEADRYYHTYVLREALEGKRSLEGYTYITNDYRANAWFYISLLQDKGTDINFIRGMPPDTLTGKVMIFTPETRTYIEENHTFERIESIENVDLLLITGKK